MIEWRNSGTAWSFWKRVLDFAEKQCRKHWMFGQSQNRKCPHCLTWASTVGGFSTTPDSDDHFSDTMHCLQCGKSSRWRNEGGFLISIPRAK